MNRLLWGWQSSLLSNTTATPHFTWHLWCCGKTRAQRKVLLHEVNIEKLNNLAAAWQTHRDVIKQVFLLVFMTSSVFFTLIGCCTNTSLKHRFMIGFLILDDISRFFPSLANLKCSSFLLVSWQHLTLKLIIIEQRYCKSRKLLVNGLLPLNLLNNINIVYVVFQAKISHQLWH